MKLKNYLYLLFGIMLMAGSAMAQQTPKKDAVEALKVAYINTRLALTPKEAEVFWPLYNEYQDKRDNLRMEQRKLRKDVKDNFENMTDKELETMIDQDLDFKQKELDLAKEFNKKMKAVLPMKKAALYYKAVEEFNKKMIEGIKEGKMGPGGKGKP